MVIGVLGTVVVEGAVLGVLGVIVLTWVLLEIVTEEVEESIDCVALAELGTVFVMDTLVAVLVAVIVAVLVAVAGEEAEVAAVVINGGRVVESKPEELFP